VKGENKMKLLKANKEILETYLKKIEKGEIVSFDYCAYSELGYTVEIPFNSLFDDEEGEQWYGVSKTRHFDGEYIVMGCWGGGGLVVHDLSWTDDLHSYTQRILDEANTDMVFIDYNSIIVVRELE